MDSDDILNHPRRTGSGIIGLIILIAIGWWAYIHWLNKPSWTAVYYPDPGNLSIFEDKAVESLDECRTWVRAKAFLTESMNYDYECGTDCRLQIDSFGKFNYCKDTFQ